VFFQLCFEEVPSCTLFRRRARLFHERYKSRSISTRHTWNPAGVEGLFPFLIASMYEAKAVPGLSVLVMGLKLAWCSDVMVLCSATSGDCAGGSSILGLV